MKRIVCSLVAWTRPVALSLGIFAFFGNPVVAEEAISFPARSADLASDSYWTVEEFSEGCCVLDLNVKRWNDGAWRGSNGGGGNDDDFDWSRPLYAPANGVVASCWRNFPNNPASGSDNHHPDYPSKILRGGNHVIIITDEGNLIELMHLKQGSTPASLCPRNADDTQYPATLSKDGGVWAIAAYVDPADRPRVSEGDFVGRVGNSGHSSGPHLHTNIRRVTGTDAKGRETTSSSFPLPIRYAWAHRYDRNQPHSPDGWFRLWGQGFSQAGNPSFKMLHASPYLRRSEAGAGPIRSEIDTLFLSSNRFVTATIGTDSDMKIISWNRIGINEIRRDHETSAVGVEDVSIVSPGADIVLAAVKKTDGFLKLIAYRVAGNGSFTRIAERNDRAIAMVDMTMTTGPDRMAVTALRLPNGKLHLIAWDVRINPSAEASIVRLGEIEGDAVSTLALAPAGFKGVYTAVRAGGELQVIPWRLSPDGMTFERRNPGVAGPIGPFLSVASLPQGVVAAAEDSDGKLAVITWSTNATGDIGARQQKTVGVASKDIRLVKSWLGDTNFTSVLRDGDGNLRLVGWAVNADGSNLRQLGSSRAGAVLGLSAASTMSLVAGQNPREFTVTAVRDSESAMKLILWDVNLLNSRPD